MDPLTHLAVSIAASRTGLDRVSRLATPMLIVSGLAADIDWLSALAGPRAFLIGHRTITHSLPGTVAIALIVAFSFTFATRTNPATAVRFMPAFVLSFIGVVLHVFFDATNSYGVKLLWPFSQRWFALDILSNFDMWVLSLLLAGILLPMLFRLVSDEIGAKQKSKSAASAAACALALVLVYSGGRYILHLRALDILKARLYRNEAPLAAGAFPDSPSPLQWTGIIVTEDALMRVDVPIALANFDPFSAKVFYKPAPSAALDAARATQTARLFLSFARFPRATIEHTDRGYHIEITDVRFEIGSPPGRSMAAVIDVNDQGVVMNEELKFGDLFQR